jgi:hypothetical protein
VITDVAAAAVVGAASAAAIGFGGGPAPDADEHAQATGDRPVTRTTLYDREEHDGTLGHGTEKDGAGRLTGTVTGLRTRARGASAAQALLPVDNSRCCSCTGRCPRTGAAPGVRGRRRPQFETELRALGYTGFTVDDEYTVVDRRGGREVAEGARADRDRRGRAGPGRVRGRRGAGRDRAASIGDAAQGDLLTSAAPAGW